MHKKYDSSASPSYKKMKDKLSISYGSGVVSGNLASENFWINPSTEIDALQFLEIESTQESLFSDVIF
jgi:hypothetical protein